MMRLNLLLFPTLLLALILYLAGWKIAAKCSSAGRLASAVLLSALLAVPALLYAFYYAHLFDSAVWFYTLRAWPGSELAASGAGLGAGLAAGGIQRSALGSRSRLIQRVTSGSLLFCLALLLFIPYGKPLIAPLREAPKDQWINGVCIQSTPSTCGPASAATLLRRFGLEASERELARECFSYGGGTENWYIARALQRRGFSTRFVVGKPRPVTILYPSIAGTEVGGPGGAGHFITILGKEDDRYLIGDPIQGCLLLTLEQLRSRFYLTGFFLVVTPSQKIFSAVKQGNAWVTPFNLHGAVHIHRYHSGALGTTRRLHVYTPPGYDPKGSQRYPVLYLLHGSPGDDTNWIAAGKANALLDTLITSRQCQPFVVVMPDSEVSGPLFGRRRFERDLLEDILPFIEKTYRVRTDAAGRALAGLSMGGFHSIAIGLNHLETFGWIGVFSAGLREGFASESDLASFASYASQSASRLKLLYVRIGKKDFFLPDARRFHRWLELRSIPHVYQEVDGTHEWPVWQKALTDFAPRLFSSPH